MTTKEMERLAGGMRKPNLKLTEVAKLLDREDFNSLPIANEKHVNKRVATQPVAQPKTKPVAQARPQRVAQVVAQPVAQAVAQGPWVAQTVAQPVAQKKAQPVAQKVAQPVAQKKAQPVAQVVMDSTHQTQADRDVALFKEKIFELTTIEERKRYCLEIGFSIKAESRGGKASYLYGIKKLEGKKYRLYIGNSASI